MKTHYTGVRDLPSNEGRDGQIRVGDVTNRKVIGYRHNLDTMREDALLQDFTKSRYQDKLLIAHGTLC